MKQNRSIYKVVCASLLLLISPSHIVSAMEEENTGDLSNDFQNLFSTKTQTVPDYNKILEEIEELTKRIHAEVDRVLADYRHDTEEYHRRMGITRGTATSVAPGTVEKEESQPEAQEKEKEEKEKEEPKKLVQEEMEALIYQLEEDLDAGAFSSAFKAMENYQKKYPNVTLRDVREDVVKAFIEKQKDGEAAQEQNAQEFLKLAELPENDAAYISAARHCLKVFEDKERISELLKYDTKSLFKVLGAIKVFQVNHVKDAPTYEDIRDLGSAIKAPGEEGKPGAEEDKKTDKLDIETDKDILIAVAKYINQYHKVPGGVVRMVESHFEGQPLSQPYMLKPDQSFRRGPLSQLRKLDEFLKDYRGQKAPGSIIVFDTLIVVWRETNVYGPHQY